VRRPDGYWLEPSPDRDPVFLNGEALSKPTQLSAGDKLAVGPLEVRFEML